jgi:lysophospholipase L1-like esterase
MYIVLALLVTLPLLFIASQAVMYLRRIRFSESLVETAVCAQSAPEDARRTLVVVGDSLAVGVGARAEESVAGRVAAAFPHVRVYNYSKAGARARDVAAQLARYTEGRADVVLIQVCANDVCGLHRIDTIEAQLRGVIDSAHGLGARVFLMPGNNFCLAPFFMWPAQPLLTYRALRIRAMISRLAEQTGVEFVDLVYDRHEDPFLREPHRYFSEDLIHPSAEGYAHYFTQLLAKGKLDRYLSA